MYLFYSNHNNACIVPLLHENKCKYAAVLLTEFYSPYSSTSNQLKLVKQCSFAMFQILYVILRENPSKKKYLKQ